MTFLKSKNTCFTNSPTILRQMLQIAYLESNSIVHIFGNDTSRYLFKNPQYNLRQKKLRQKKEKI